MALPTIDALLKQDKQLCPKRLAADKGYDSDVFAEELLERDILPYLIPRKFKNKTRHTFFKPSEPPPPHRWKVERTHAWWNQQRRISGFYEKKRSTYEAFLATACIRFYLKRLHKNSNV